MIGSWRHGVSTSSDRTCEVVNIATSLAASLADGVSLETRCQLVVDLVAAKNPTISHMRKDVLLQFRPTIAKVIAGLSG